MSGSAAASRPGVEPGALARPELIALDAWPRSCEDAFPEYLEAEGGGSEGQGYADFDALEPDTFVVGAGACWGRGLFQGAACWGVSLVGRLVSHNVVQSKLVRVPPINHDSSAPLFTPVPPRPCVTR
jgi:hypothetical protein